MVSRGLEIADDEIELHQRVKNEKMEQSRNDSKASFALSSKNSYKNKLKNAENIH